MKNSTKKIIFLTICFYLSFLIGKSLYYYYCDTSIPTIIFSGIEENEHYSGNLPINITVSDEYKVKNISIFIDDKVVLNKHSINNKNYNYLLSIPTFSMEDGKHELKILATDSSKRANNSEKKIEFFIDNTPLEVSIIQKESLKVFQGETLHIIFQANKEIKNAYAKTLTYKAPFVLESNKSRIYECYIPISTDEIPNEYLITIDIYDKVGNFSKLEETYQIIEKDFKKEKINVTKKLDYEIALSSNELANQIEIATKNSPEKKLWSGKFYIPCAYKKISQNFGTIRTVPERGRYRHHGIDFSAAPKSTVWAAQDGIIVIKDNFLYTGNTVAIDHGCGIITVYAHLDSFASIEIGQNIKRGNIIGTIGMTGYATGYHLHWELRIFGTPVNPYEWIKDDI